MSSPVPQYHDPNTRASDAVGVTVDDAKLKALCPGLYGFWGALLKGSELARLKEHVQLGDSRAAMVMWLDPLLVAAYTDELDCVAMLKFPQSLVAQYGLKVGMPLLTVNVYPTGRNQAGDLTPGPQNFGRYPNMWPIIAEFVSSDYPRIEARKQGIAREEWERCWAMGSAYLQQRPGLFRDGTPTESLHPPNKKWKFG